MSQNTKMDTVSKRVHAAQVKKWPFLNPQCCHQKCGSKSKISPYFVAYPNSISQLAWSDPDSADSAFPTPTLRSAKGTVIVASVAVVRAVDILECACVR